MHIDVEVGKYSAWISLMAWRLEISAQASLTYWLFGVVVHMFDRSYSDVQVGVGPLSVCLSYENYS